MYVSSILKLCNIMYSSNALKWHNLKMKTNDNFKMFI